MNNSQNKDYFLALTGNDDFWNKSRPLLFLGEWCENPEKENIWKNLDYKVFNSEKLDYKDSLEAYNHVNSIYEELLPKFSKWMNKFHQKDYSIKYWRLMIGPFLLWYTHIIYERYIYLKTVYQVYPNIETFGLNKENYLTPSNTAELICLGLCSDDWNLQIFTQLLDLKFKRPINYKNTDWAHDLKHRRLNYIPIHYRSRSKYLTKIFKFINSLNFFHPIHILSSNFSKNDLIMLMVRSRFKIIPMFPMKPINRGGLLDESLLLKKNNFIDREKLLEINTNDELASLVIKTLQVNMPLIFIEGYKQEETASKKYFPYKSNTVFVDMVASYDQYKFWIGEQIEKNKAILINQQHGGCYGIQKYCVPELLERQNSNYFISWGWKSEKVIPLGMPLYNKFKKYHKKSIGKKDKIFWITTYASRYNITLKGWTLNDKKSYFNIQKKFFNKVLPSIGKTITMRVDPCEPNIKEIMENIPNLEVCFPTERDSFYDQVAIAKLIILDNPSTALLNVLAFNVPTILFWDKSYWSFRKDAEVFLDELEQVGVYYSNPEDAARMVNKISDKPDVWWSDKSIQFAREQFVENYAKISPAYLKDTKNKLLSLNR